LEPRRPCARRLAPDREQQRRIAVVGFEVDRAELALLDRTTDVLASRARPASPLLHSCHTVHRQSTCSSMRDFQTSNRRMILHHELLQSPRCGGGPAPRGWPPPPTMDRRGAFFIYCGDPEIFLTQKSRGGGSGTRSIAARTRRPSSCFTSERTLARGRGGDRLYALHVEYVCMSYISPGKSERIYLLQHTLHTATTTLSTSLYRMGTNEGFSLYESPAYNFPIRPYVGHPSSDGIATRTKVPSGCGCSWPIWISWAIISRTSFALSRQRMCCWNVRAVAGAPVRLRART
jgi:hypothetical protein